MVGEKLVRSSKAPLSLALMVLYKRVSCVNDYNRLQIMFSQSCT